LSEEDEVDDNASVEVDADTEVEEEEEAVSVARDDLVESMDPTLWVGGSLTLRWTIGEVWADAD